MQSPIKLLVVVALAALPVALVIFGTSEPTAQRPPAGRDDAVHFAKLIVKEFIRSPATAQFPDDSEIKTEQISERVWRVKGYVSTVSATKSRVVIPWEIEIEEQENRWRLVKREMNLSPLTKSVREESWTNHLQPQK